MTIPTEPIGSIPRPPELHAVHRPDGLPGYPRDQFCDDLSTTRDTAYAKIRARVDGTALAAAILERRK